MAAVAAVCAVAIVFVLRRPPPRPVIETASLPLPAASSSSVSVASLDGAKRRVRDDTVVVYVAGAIKRPGLYLLRSGDRYARALTLAGGLSADADPAGVNLAQRAADGDEIDVPVRGAFSRSSSRGPAAASRRHKRSSHPSPPPEASIDVNGATPAELAAVPGIGRAVAGRIVELRRREGNFASLDELLDVAGMTAARLERARPYLRDP
jgi:competence protein ComEA